MNMMSEDDKDVLALAETYAEFLGPDGVMKQYLGQVRLPAIGAIGGRMLLGPKWLLRVVVTGIEVEGGGAES